MGLPNGRTIPTPLPPLLQFLKALTANSQHRRLYLCRHRGDMACNEQSDSAAYAAALNDLAQLKLSEVSLRFLLAHTSCRRQNVVPPSSLVQGKTEEAQELFRQALDVQQGQQQSAIASDQKPEKQLIEDDWEAAAEESWEARKRIYLHGFPGIFAMLMWFLLLQQRLGRLHLHLQDGMPTILRGSTDWQGSAYKDLQKRSLPSVETLSAAVALAARSRQQQQSQQVQGAAPAATSPAVRRARRCHLAAPTFWRCMTSRPL
jgi:hypothetical protein